MTAVNMLIIQYFYSRPNVGYGSPLDEKPSPPHLHGDPHIHDIPGVRTGRFIHVRRFQEIIFLNFF